MKNLNLFIISLMICGSSMAQRYDRFGFFVQANTSSQWVKVPALPENGTFSYNFRNGFGGGIFYQHRLTNRIWWRPGLSYSQKGFMHHHQDGMNRLVKKYDLHYLGFDNRLQARLFHVAGSPLYMNLGLRNERLLGHNLGRSRDNPNGNAAIQTGDYQRWSFGGIISLDYQINDKLSIDIGMNPDIAPAMDESQALIRNFMWFVNLGMLIKKPKQCNFTEHPASMSAQI